MQRNSHCRTGRELKEIGQKNNFPNNALNAIASKIYGAIRLYGAPA